MVYNNLVHYIFNSGAQYFFISTARVYAGTEERITEKSPRLIDVCNDYEYLKTDEYALSKARQENTLLTSNNKNWIIIRPYITFSENRLQLGPFEKEFWLYRALQGKKVVVTSDFLEKETTLTYGKSVAEAIISLLGKKSASGEIFNVATNKSLKWRSVLDIYSQAFEETIGRRMLIYETEKWHQRMGGGSWQFKYDRLYNRLFDDSKIRSYLSDFSNDPYNDLYECIKYFLRHPKFNAITWASEAYKDRITHELNGFNSITGFKNKLKYYIVRFGFYS